MTTVIDLIRKLPELFETSSTSILRKIIVRFFRKIIIDEKGMSNPKINGNLLAILSPSRDLSIKKTGQPLKSKVDRLSGGYRDRTGHLKHAMLALYQMS